MSRSVGGGDEVAQLAPGVVGGGVLLVDGTEGERHVAPVAALVGIVLVHGHQLDHGHAEGGEPVEVGDDTGERARRPARRADG